MLNYQRTTIVKYKWLNFRIEKQFIALRRGQ